ncbi:hypothetical protein [Arenibaculum pallidiluteum]|uniref:hypothetical protein n=1 Tax=Arenibaculum pallidiluteum TaxID=2812559 RepID=UPI001A9765C5|nr:hypothetical protein [Arenibaculum pallidiluteum]
MSPAVHPPSREDVLGAFAVELNPNRATLERYLRAYPAYAVELIDLSRELARDICEDEKPLSPADQAQIDKAWLQHAEAAPKTVTDPFTNAPPHQLREVAKRLDVPRQIITAFREHRVILETVPRQFLERFADSLNCSLDTLIQTLAPGSRPVPARSYKADGKPVNEGPVSFERLLIDAGVPADKRSQLLADAE